MIESNIEKINLMNTNGLFIFSGITDLEEDIFEIIEPQLTNKMFYYNCGAKFITDIFESYYDDYNGTVIFIDGKECFIYKFNNSIGNFEIFNHFDSRITNKHNKGGQSSVRFGRIADNICDKYIITIIKNLNKLSKFNNWIFGSKDIIDDLFERKNEIIVKINNGSYLEFNKDTIKDVRKWISYMKQEEYYDDICKKILEYIDLNPDLLDFEIYMINCIEKYEYIILTPQHPFYDKIENSDKIIKLSQKSKFYGKLSIYLCIGKYYYSQYNMNDNAIITHNENIDDFM